MRIEIKSRWDGKVLYTAENAQDVKQAVEEAVKAGVSLEGANLFRANLVRANLGGANLGGAYHWSHPFWHIRQDYFSILDQAPAEVATLRQTILDGRIDGSTYTGECSCLAGTIAVAHGCSVSALDVELGIEKNADRPAEQWFISIERGDKPLPVDETKEFPSEGVFRISWALAWLDEWVASRTAVGSVLAGGEAV